MKHRIEPPRARTLEGLGKQLAELRYDALIVVIRAYEEELKRQQDVDARRGHKKLAQLGGYLLPHVDSHLYYLGQMLKVSTPYMRNDIQERPLPTDKVEL